MQEMCSSNPPVVTEICDPNKPRARCYPSLKLDVETSQNLVYDISFIRGRIVLLFFLQPLP